MTKLIFLAKIQSLKFILDFNFDHKLDIIVINPAYQKLSPRKLSQNSFKLDHSKIFNNYLHKKKLESNLRFYDMKNTFQEKLRLFNI